MTETVGLARGAPATVAVKWGGRVDIWDAGRRVVPNEDLPELMPIEAGCTLMGYSLNHRPGVKFPRVKMVG